MPWQECNKVDERLKFIARLLDGESMAGLCGGVIKPRGRIYPLPRTLMIYGVLIIKGNSCSVIDATAIH